MSDIRLNKTKKTTVLLQFLNVILESRITRFTDFILCAEMTQTFLPKDLDEVMIDYMTSACFV